MTVYLASISGCGAGVHADHLHVFISYPANSVSCITLSVLYSTQESMQIFVDAKDRILNQYKLTIQMLQYKHINYNW